MVATKTYQELNVSAEYSGTGVNDNDVLFTVSEARPFDSYTLMSTDGAVDVQVTLNGTDWSSAPLSLTDMGAITSDPVLVTVADRVYAFRGKFRGVRVLQNGASAATASLMCGNS